MLDILMNYFHYRFLIYLSEGFDFEIMAKTKFNSNQCRNKIYFEQLEKTKHLYEIES